MGHGFFRAVSLDDPGQHRSNSKSGNQRQRPGPGQRIRTKRRHHDQKSNHRPQRSQHQRQHRVGVQLPDMLRQGSERKEEIAHNAAPPAQLLLEQHRQSVRHGGPAQRVIVDVSSVAPQQRLMRQKPVFPLIHRNAEPVARPDRRLDLKQQLRRIANRHPLMQHTLRVQFSGIL
jgi:hypothetical protein